MSWTAAQKEYLKENYYKGAKAVSTELGKSTLAVYGMASKLGLTSCRPPIQSTMPTKEELAYYKSELRDILGVDKQSSLC